MVNACRADRESDRPFSSSIHSGAPQQPSLQSPGLSCRDWFIICNPLFRETGSALAFKTKAAHSTSHSAERTLLSLRSITVVHDGPRHDWTLDHIRDRLTADTSLWHRTVGTAPGSKRR